jgi:hypothetical protein
MDYRTSASFGKRQEFVAVAELLKRGFDIYMTLVDDQQIDCIIRLEHGGELKYLDVQIKARSRNAKYGATFSAMTIRDPRPNFWFIFYSEAAETYWVIPSRDVVKLASVNKGGKTGKHTGKLTLVLCNRTKQGLKPRPKLKQFENAFHLLNQGANRVVVVPLEGVAAR